MPDFGYVRIYPMAHRKYEHTSLSRYFIDTGFLEHINSDNDWEMTRINKWKKLLDNKVGI